MKIKFKIFNRIHKSISIYTRKSETIIHLNPFYITKLYA